MTRYSFAQGDTPASIAGTVNDSTGTLQTGQVTAVTFRMWPCGGASASIEGPAEIVGNAEGGGVDVRFDFPPEEVSALGRNYYVTRWQVTTEAGTFSAPGDTWNVVAVT